MLMLLAATADIQSPSDYSNSQVLNTIPRFPAGGVVAVAAAAGVRGGSRRNSLNLAASSGGVGAGGAAGNNGQGQAAASGSQVGFEVVAASGSLPLIGGGGSRGLGHHRNVSSYLLSSAEGIVVVRTQ